MSTWPERCVHCNRTRSGHGLSSRACLAAGYYGNHFTTPTPDASPDPAVTPDAGDES